ncbi:hypothetical protein K488DRAFT_88741 [Vararia minispora EC-137]|uniref:Uncharacterized protein n=1 Tax=Vararia minispora EC-137 TaxID=1314806 RepID=A0ACB8QCR3_9AGAM|nr:hypothetical protein K488DRAFT_88741 [Vararia minispora EC-137]
MTSPRSRATTICGYLGSPRGGLPCARRHRGTNALWGLPRARERRARSSCCVASSGAARDFISGRQRARAVFSTPDSNGGAQYTAAAASSVVHSWSEPLTSHALLSVLGASFKSNSPPGISRLSRPHPSGDTPKRNQPHPAQTPSRPHAARSSAAQPRTAHDAPAPHMTHAPRAASSCRPARRVQLSSRAFRPSPGRADATPATPRRGDAAPQRAAQPRVPVPVAP